MERHSWVVQWVHCPRGVVTGRHRGSEGLEAGCRGRGDGRPPAKDCSWPLEAGEGMPSLWSLRKEAAVLIPRLEPCDPARVGLLAPDCEGTNACCAKLLRLRPFNAAAAGGEDGAQSRRRRRERQWQPAESASCPGRPPTPTPVHLRLQCPQAAIRLFLHSFILSPQNLLETLCSAATPQAPCLSSLPCLRSLSTPTAGVTCAVTRGLPLSPPWPQSPEPLPLGARLPWQPLTHSRCSEKSLEVKDKRFSPALFGAVFCPTWSSGRLIRGPRKYLSRE